VLAAVAVGTGAVVVGPVVAVGPKQAARIMLTEDTIAKARLRNADFLQGD
jgi:hypothetical protein